MTARSARLATAGGCAAVLALAACSAGSSTTAKHASPAASPKPVIAGEPGAPPKEASWLSPAPIMTARTSAAAEATLDVEAAHLMAPGASLLLVEIPQLRSSLGISGVVKAMVYVIRHHLASVMSLASAEGENLASSLRRYHRAILAAGRSWPGSNGDRSTVFARPSYQSTVAGVAGRWRAVPDISLDASPGAALEMYATPRSIGFRPADKWSPNSGTSLATPLFAGVVALAGQLAGRPLGPISPLLYQLSAQHDPGIVDVQGQGNTFHAGHLTIRGFPAGPGSDLVTGVGTIDAAKLVPDLVRLSRQEAS